MKENEGNVVKGRGTIVAEYDDDIPLTKFGVRFYLFTNLLTYLFEVEADEGRNLNSTTACS